MFVGRDARRAGTTSTGIVPPLRVKSSSAGCVGRPSPSATRPLLVALRTPTVVLGLRADRRGRASQREPARARDPQRPARARDLSPAGRFGSRARQTHVLKAIGSEPGGFFAATPSPLDVPRARAPSVTQITVVTEIATRRMAPRDQAKISATNFDEVPSPSSSVSYTHLTLPTKRIV